MRGGNGRSEGLARLVEEDGATEGAMQVVYEEGTR
jgi:hypothetical protein